ncbi:hypothetical protein D3C87_466360 [compost metagenome]
MSNIVTKATTSCDDEIWIEYHPSSLDPRPFKLDCGFNRRGLKTIEEFPRWYKSLPSAKAAATKLLGKLNWKDGSQDNPA